MYALRLSSEHIAICEVIIIDEQIAGIGFIGFLLIIIELGSNILYELRAGLETA